MKNYYRILLLAIVWLVGTTSLEAREFIGTSKSTKTVKAGNAAGCTAASGFQMLDVNNVRGRVNTGGDLWWDVGGGVGPMYYIPANSSKTSLFAGALWIGGVDVNDQLKVAAQRFRQGPDLNGGVDFWTGPLTVDGTASISADVCSKWDKLFVISRAEVDQFIAWFESEDRSNEFPGYSIPDAIKNWPAHGDDGQSWFMAPFFDRNKDGFYNPDDGDYPYYDRTNELCHSDRTTPDTDDGTVIGGLLSDQVLKGDKTFWWVFNDKGNVHTETNASPIGLEIRAQAFAFTTNDEINNMTFYSYEIINRSTFTLKDTYFSPWTDPDLGYENDDYVGCDVNRGMGYAYNGKDTDGSGELKSYGSQPPAVGIDFFQGPYMDPDGYDNPSFQGDGINGPSYKGDCSIVTQNGTLLNFTYGPENAQKTGQFLVRSEAINGVNFGNGIKDDERFGMRRFLYFNNDGSDKGDPKTGAQYYNYLRGIWKNNALMQYGGDAFNTGTVGPATDFMFPGDSDPCNWGTQGTPPGGGYNQNGKYWTEKESGNNPADRRFMQSAGPFTLKPGAVNYITFGVPWARAVSGGAFASVELLRVVDDKCQALFDNCFKVLDGPDAPDMTIRELDKKVIIYLTNKKSSNNYLEGYIEKDPSIVVGDPYFRFEGYQIFQLANSQVSVESIYDVAKARLVAQYDIKNGVGKLVNFNADEKIGYEVPQVMVEGGDAGVEHSFVVTEDLFATGDRNLVNHKQYYYMVVAYSYNNFKTYDPSDPNPPVGQKKPYLAGRRNIQVYTAMPHQIVNGDIVSSDYNDVPSMTRIEGQGNGGNFLVMDQASVDNVLAKGPLQDGVSLGDPNYPIVYQPTYEKGYSPLTIKVVDPLKVKNGKYNVRFTDGTANNNLITKARWELTDLSTGEVYKSDTTISVDNDQLILDLGLSVHITQIPDPGPEGGYSANGFIGWTVSGLDATSPWLLPIGDETTPSSPQNWIRSGTYFDDVEPSNDDAFTGSEPRVFLDPGEDFEKIYEGSWAPYPLVADRDGSSNNTTYGPGYNKGSRFSVASMEGLQSVDIVFTADKSKWSRALVIEMCNDATLSEGGAKAFEARKGLSVDKNGKQAVPGSGVSTNPEDPNYMGETGYGWFPGYAINVETGERLNLMFGENSFLVKQNGRDMLYNPSGDIYEGISGGIAFGGMHYIYVMGTATERTAVGSYKFESPAYDDCKKLGQLLNDYSAISNQGFKKKAFESFYGTTQWVGLLSSNSSLPANSWLSSDVKFQIRVAKPYRRYFSLPFDVAASSYSPVNDMWPLYNFSTEGMEYQANDPEKAVSDLDKIKIVPNPYYSYSTYDNNTLQNKVKVTALPRKCTVTIYSVNGTLLRQFTKDSDVPEIEWDLKNFAGIPISGGLYLVHVKTEAGERILRWFGTMRPVDLNSF